MVNKEMRTGWAVYVKDYPVDAIEQQSDGLAVIIDALNAARHASVYSFSLLWK